MPADFRSAVVSADHRFVGYVRTNVDGDPEIVVATRDGSSEHAMPVFGAAAMNFDPTSDRLASIGPNVPIQGLTIPLGPLRVIDGPTGDIRRCSMGRS